MRWHTYQRVGIIITNTMVLFRRNRKNSPTLQLKSCWEFIVHSVVADVKDWTRIQQACTFNKNKIVRRSHCVSFYTQTPFPQILPTVDPAPATDSGLLSDFVCFFSLSFSFCTCVRACTVSFYFLWTFVWNKLGWWSLLFSECLLAWLVRAFD